MCSGGLTCTKVNIHCTILYIFYKNCAGQNFISVIGILEITDPLIGYSVIVNSIMTFSKYNNSVIIA